MKRLVSTKTAQLQLWPCDHYPHKYGSCNDSKCPCECYRCRNTENVLVISEPYNVHYLRHGMRWARMYNGYVYEFQYLGNTWPDRPFRNTLIVTRIKIYRNAKCEVTKRMFRNVTRVRTNYHPS